MEKKAPITLYGMAASTCTQRVIATLTEKGLSFTLQPIDLLGGEHKTEKYLEEKHPFGVIPVFIDDNGFKVYEMKYKGKGAELIPSKDVKAQGLFEQAASTEMSYFDPYASGIVFERIFKKMLGKGEPDEARVTECKQQLSKNLDVYEKILSKQTYLAGETFTLADLFHLPYGALLGKAGEGDFFESRPHVKAWWKKITARTSWKTVQAMQ